MKKLLPTLGLLLALAASGCTLYFGPEDEDSDYYSYCDATGCWTCNSETGECWSDGGGTQCYSDYDCAAGCYCDAASGSCIETGFCTYDSDCPEGYSCDDRASCTPGGNYCWETGCEAGSYCDSWTGECIPSTTCTTPEDCGTGYTCDETGTCVPVGCTNDDDCAAACYCDETTGGCVESSFCSAPGECPEGQMCDVERSTCIPGEEVVPCSDLSPPNGTEEDCAGRAECEVVLGGVNCTPACSIDPNSPARIRE